MQAVLWVLTGCWVLGTLGAAQLVPGLRYGCVAIGVIWMVALPFARRSALVFLLGLGLVSTVTSWLRTSERLNPPRAPCHVSHHTSRTEVRLWLQMTGAPVATGRGQRQLARALALRDDDSRDVVLCGTVELLREAGDRPLWPGQQVVVYGRLRRARLRGTPGSGGSALRRLSEDIGAVVFAPEDRLVRLGNSPSPLLERLRWRVRRVLRRSLALPGDRAVLAALVLGEKAGLSDRQRSRFARAGVGHVLAVSGLHLSLVAFSALGLLEFLLLRLALPLARRCAVRRWAAAGATLVAIVYTLLAGAAPGAARACVMACAAFCAILFNRPRGGVGPLLLAALLLLALDPLALFQPAFQLSFAAVCGLMLVTQHRWYHLCARGGRWRRAVVGLIAASVGATLLTAPLSAHHFQSVSLVGVAANLLAVPWTSLVLLPTALLGAILGSLWLPLGQLVLPVAAWSAHVLDQGVAVAATVPVAAWQVALPWALALPALALAVAVLADAPALRRASVLVAAVGLCAYGWTAWSDRRPRLEVNFLDVGDGDSALLRLPDDTTMLVDAGGREGGDYDPGARIVVPFLRWKGIRKIDYLVVTHAHIDHLGGATAVLEQLPVGELWACPGPEPAATMRRLLRKAELRGVPVRSPRVLRRGPVNIRPLWPPYSAAGCGDEMLSTNDNSIVLRVGYGAGALLLAGDVEAEAEQALVDREGQSLRATVLKVPHHGSATSSTWDWLRAVAPRLAVVSCAADSPYGVPHAAVLERYERLSIPVVRTDEQGAITVLLFDDGALRWYAPFSSLP